jgi:AraC-like DNA-binding protein
MIEATKTKHLRQLVRQIPPPASLYSGIGIDQSLAPDNIIFFQRSDSAAMRPEAVNVNFHHRFELVTVFDTAAPARIDRSTCELRPGECALIFPNQFHHFMDVAQSHLEWLFITFELRDPEAILALRNSPRVLDPGGIDLLHGIVREFVQPASGTRDTLEISYRLSRLLLHLCKCRELPSERRDIHSGDNARDVILEKINRYVREHLHESVTIADLATDLGYSVSHLRAVFRDRLGVSLGRYMRESRLSEAAQLLQREEFNIGEIGERCGFESLFAFSRAFRKSYGMPPRSYRQLVQNGAGR